jgi:hypothetical protein
VVWATTPGSTAICKQQVTRSDAAGAATALRASATATSIGDRISAPGSVGYTVTAVGCNGLSGAAAGPSYRYAVTQQNDPAVSYSGTWSTVACADCSGSSVAESRTAGASVTFPVTNAYAAALVVRAGPQQSTFKVYVDGTLVGTQNVTLSTAQNRFIAFTRTWPIPGNHTIKVVNNASSAAPVLDVDGLLSLSA